VMIERVGGKEACVSCEANLMLHASILMFPFPLCLSIYPSMYLCAHILQCCVYLFACVFVYISKGKRHGGFQSCLTKVSHRVIARTPRQKALGVMRVHTDMCELWLKICDCIWTVSGTYVQKLSIENMHWNDLASVCSLHKKKCLQFA